MTSGPSPSTAQWSRMPFVSTMRCSSAIVGRHSERSGALSNRSLLRYVCATRRDVMQLEFVRYEKRNRIAWVTIQRPEVMNALHPPANEELARVWDDFAEDAE